MLALINKHATTVISRHFPVQPVEEQKVFRTTKEAMEWAQRNDIPTVVPVGVAGLAAEEAHPEDFCKKCGRPNIVWFAPNSLWNKVVRVNNHPGVLCPICFVELAEAIGIREVWKVAPNEKSARKLTLPELNHLSGLLEARRDEGSYTGPREQYYARTERLIQWCDDQIKGASNGLSKNNRNLSR